MIGRVGGVCGVAIALAIVADAAPPDDAPKPTEPSVKFVTSAVEDEGLGAPAVHVLAPERWRVEGAVTWRAQSAAPAEVRLKVYSPDDGRAFELLPRRAFAWRVADDPASPRPLASDVHQMPPIGDSVVFIERVVVPELHPAATSVQVISREPLPAVARAVAGAAGEARHRDVSAARVRVRASENGASWDEDIYCVLVQTRAPAGGEEIVYWGPERLYVLRARQDQLERAGAVLESVASSFRLDATWSARYAALLRMLEERDARTRLGEAELASLLAQARRVEADGRSFSARDAEERRARINSVLSAHFGRTETLFDPRNEREVLLPRGYAHAWASERGDYLVTSTPDLDPRSKDAGGRWAELHAVSAR